MESDEAWYAAQRVGAPFVKAAGIVGVVTGVAALPFSETPAAGIILGGAVVMTILVLVGGARGQRAASDAA